MDPRRHSSSESFKNPAIHCGLSRGPRLAPFVFSSGSLASRKLFRLLRLWLLPCFGVNQVDPSLIFSNFLPQRTGKSCLMGHAQQTGDGTPRATLIRRGIMFRLLQGPFTHSELVFFFHLASWKTSQASQCSPWVTKL